MTHCKDCKHWLPPQPAPVYPFETAPAPWHQETHGTCTRIVHVHKKHQSYHVETKAFVIDSDEYQAWLSTSAEFGCTAGETNQ